MFTIENTDEVLPLDASQMWISQVPVWYGVELKGELATVLLGPGFVTFAVTEVVLDGDGHSAVGGPTGHPPGLFNGQGLIIVL
jgi:hypothetical protein